MLASQMSLLNGLVGETESLIKAVLTTIEENFSTDDAYLKKTGDILISMLGMLVAVPSNPEDQFFQIAEAIIQMLKIHDWGV